MVANPLINPIFHSKKNERKQKYQDLAVQGTNNSSIASKRSVESIYLPKFADYNNDEFIEYFKFFVPKVINRSPCINRGYWLRLHAIKSRLDSIISNQPKDRKIAIVNLGCGFDPLPFQLLDARNRTSQEYNNRTICLDIDYKSLLNNKIKIIEDNNELLEIVGRNSSSQNTVPLTNGIYTTSNYYMRPCDLNNSDDFNQLLLDSKDDLPFLYDASITKIFVAEVSLAYMKSKLADKIIKITSEISNSHFIMLEQLIPEGPYEPFSKQMLKHFKKNDSPLQTVTEYNTIESQIDRFNKLGYGNVNAGDMLQLWNNLPMDTKRLIESIQPFDELEEFHLFCHHYILLHGTNETTFEFKSPYKFNDTNHLSGAKIGKYHPNSSVELSSINLKRNFGSSLLLKESNSDSSSLLYFGGCTPFRVNETLKIDTSNNKENDNIGDTMTVLEKTKDIIPARTCHTMTEVNNYNNNNNNNNNDDDDDECIIVIGGRNAPHKPYNDTWKYSRISNEWFKSAELPQPRFRHCSVPLTEDKILVFGGKSDTKHETLPPFLIYDLKEDSITADIKAVGICSSLVSAAMDYHPSTQTLVIMGGQEHMTDTVSDILTVACINEDNGIHKTQEFKNPLFQRYGAKLKFISETEVAIVGGTSPAGLFNDKTSIIVANIATGDILSVPIPSDIWQGASLMLVGFDMEWNRHKRELLIVGGAATCYGFGLVTNQTLKVKL